MCSQRQRLTDRVGGSLQPVAIVLRITDAAAHAGTRKLGTLALGPRMGGVAFSPREKERLQKTASLVAVALSMSGEQEIDSTIRS